MAAPTRKPIEIDLTGIDLESIKLFQEEGHETPAMAAATTPPPPCAFCNPPLCTSTQSNFVRK